MDSFTSAVKVLCAYYLCSCSLKDGVKASQVIMGYLQDLLPEDPVIKDTSPEELHNPEIYCSPEELAESLQSLTDLTFISRESIKPHLPYLRKALLHVLDKTCNSLLC